MNTRILPIVATLLLVTGTVYGQRETKFATSFEYGDFSDEPIVIEPADLNSAIDQIGLWAGEVIPETAGGDILIAPDSVGFKNNPYDGSRLLLVDRPAGNADGDFKGHLDATLTEPILLLGAEISFELGTRRTGGNNNKDYDIVGIGSDGAESFRVRVGTNNNGGERLGYVTDDGATVQFDLPTVVGEDRGTDMNNTGYNANLPGPFEDDLGGPGVNAEFPFIKISLGADGYVIDLAHQEQNTSGEANAYTTDTLPYNGNATDLAIVEFGYSGSSATGRNSGWFLDNILVTGFEDILQGDFDQNGKLDFADFTILADNFGLQTSEGDYDFNGVVDLVDFSSLKAAFNAQPSGAAAAASVPEPSSLMLWGALGVIGFLLRRRAG